MADLPALRESTRHLFQVLGRRARRAFRAGIDHVPTACLLCQGKAKGGGLCVFCRESVLRSMGSALPRCPTCCLALNAASQCPDCALRVPAFDRVIAAFDYAPPADLLIHQLKAGKRFSSAGMLAGLLADAADRAMPALPGNTILVPVPANRASIIQRGFNPAAEIARCLSGRLDFPCRPELLLRAREGRRQTHLKRAERAGSAQSLYTCPRPVTGAAIAVVDDVLTTGSTLHSIAREFRAAGAASVYGLVLARTPFVG